MADVKVRIELNNNFKDFDKYNGLKDIESVSQSSPDAGSIYYDSLESSGSLEIIDKDGKIYEMISKDEIDNSNTNISIISNGKLIQKHLGNDSSYNKNEKVLNVELGNRLNDLDTLKYQGYPYPDKPESLATLLFDVLKNLRYVLFGQDKELTLNEFKTMLSDKYDDSQTLYEFLESTVLDYPIIEANDTYRNVISKFCVAAQMQMFIDDDNNVKFVSARPKHFENFNQAIYIPKKNMFSQLDYDVVLKNKYDGVEVEQSEPKYEVIGNEEVYSSDVIDLSNLTITDFPYITNNELYTKTTGENYNINYNYDYGTKVSNLTTVINRAKYVMSKYYYKTFKIKVPKKSEDNLTQVLEIKKYLVSDESKSYNLTYEKTTGRCSGDYNTSTNRFTSITRDTTPSPEYPGSLFPTQEGNGTLNGSISESGINDVVSLEDEDGSKILDISTYDDFYMVTAKVLVSLEKLSIWYSSPSSISSSGWFEKYLPKSLTISIYGSTRTIKFNNIDKSTNNIENSKTKVSINSNTLLQTDEIIRNIKSNIISDYAKGISSGSVTISCSDYYNQINQKKVDWQKGEVIKVNDVVCFENDKYLNGNQRYWKVKGRTFRKQGVPMVDLKLEEVNNYKLEDYTWSQIQLISESGNAPNMFKIGDEKTLTLSTGKTITLQIAEFNSKHAIPREYGEENTPSITFVCKDSVFSYFMSGGGGSFTESPIYAQIMEVLYSFPQGLEDLILASDYGGDLLWLLQKEFVTSGNPDKLPLFDNTANLAKGYKWWLYPKELYYKDVYIVDENGQVVYEPDMSKDYGVVLGFYI